MMKKINSKKKNTSRITIKSVTCFLNYQDEFLFVHRTKKGNDTDAQKLNGIGGKLEPGENFLECALREIAEETGYHVSGKECTLAGVVNMTGGYKNDWLMCFFVINVSSKEIPIGSENAEGELHWINKDELLQSNFNLVDDLHYCWQDIVNKKLFFASAKVNEHEKIKVWNANYLTR